MMLALEDAGFASLIHSLLSHASLEEKFRLKPACMFDTPSPPKKPLLKGELLKWNKTSFWSLIRNTWHKAGITRFKFFLFIFGSFLSAGS